MTQLYVLITSQDDHAGPTGDASLTQQLAEEYPDTYRLAPNVVVISHPDTTTREISEILFPRDNDHAVPGHVVLRFDSYYGYTDQQLWEWLTTGD